MGIRKRGMRRMERAVTAALEEVFPGEVMFRGETLGAAGVGGAHRREFDENGFPVTRLVRTVRVQKAALEIRPKTGEVIQWRAEDETAWQPLRVLEVPDRPQESAWFILCSEP